MLLFLSFCRILLNIWVTSPLCRQSNWSVTGCPTLDGDFVAVSFQSIGSAPALPNSSYLHAGFVTFWIVKNMSLAGMILSLLILVAGVILHNIKLLSAAIRRKNNVLSRSLGTFDGFSAAWLIGQQLVCPVSKKVKLKYTFYRHWGSVQAIRPIGGVDV